MSRFRYLCIHAHFDQPPRGNPITGLIGPEPDAGGFRNWNERITAESYRPNADMGNFERISFNMGEPLLAWLKRRAVETYQRIVQADRLHYQRRKVGNAIGMPAFNVILPLLKRRDMITQLHWGRVAFRHHFGRDPQGLWMPEMAVDHTSLEAVHSLGYQFVIVAQGQVTEWVQGSGPYWVELGDERRLAVYVRQDELSNDLSFNIANVGGAGHWARQQLLRRGGPLTLIAVDGETFGHHHIGEEQFLHWLLEHEAPSVGYKVVTLEEHLREVPPQQTITLKPFSSWNCFHGVDRWLTGCACTPGDSHWKPAFSHAREVAASALDDLYQQAAYTAGVDPWLLRNDYARVWMGDVDARKFLSDHAVSLTSAKETRLLGLLEAQVFLARSYVSDGLYHADIDRTEGRSLIASLGYAVHLAEEATGEKLADTVQHALLNVKSRITGVTGAEIYAQVGQEYGWMPLPPLPPEEGGATTEAGAVDTVGTVGTVGTVDTVGTVGTDGTSAEQTPTAPSAV
jgi:alpha-amylase/alpha-mannosidase (GH57 family)